MVVVVVCLVEAIVASPTPTQGLAGVCVVGDPKISATGSHSRRLSTLKGLRRPDLGALPGVARCNSAFDWG